MNKLVIPISKPRDFVVSEKEVNDLASRIRSGYIALQQSHPVKVKQITECEIPAAPSVTVR
jgi:hypothetical protein